MYFRVFPSFTTADTDSANQIRLSSGLPTLYVAAEWGGLASGTDDGRMCE